MRPCPLPEGNSVMSQREGEGGGGGGGREGEGGGGREGGREGDMFYTFKLYSL